jgi:hypothetical protein
MDKNTIIKHIKKGFVKAKKKDKKVAKEDFERALYELEVTLAWSIANH